MASSTPSDQRSPSSIMCLKFFVVRTSARVARIAANESALPARVEPIPPVSIISRITFALIRSATSFVIPNVPVGIPPPIDLPIVNISGFKPN